MAIQSWTMHHDSSRIGEIFLRVLGVAMALAAWYPVVRPGTVIRWKRSAPLSVLSKVVVALTMTAWCLAIFGVYPLYCATAAFVCIAALVVLTRKDRRAYDRMHGIAGMKSFPVRGRDLWQVFWFCDALALIPSGIALIRDWFWPPITEDQHILHKMALGLFALSVIGAIVLLRNGRREGYVK